MNDYLSQRQEMVTRQICSRGVSDQKVVDAMLSVPREEFVTRYEKSSSYHDGPLPIGHRQTISQPYIVAYMTEMLELKGDETVLELGTGSGYQTAVLAEIAKHVYTVEVIEPLWKRAQSLLEEELGYGNISFKCANGREGWPEHAPFDRIMITAAPVTFPELLFDQLVEGGVAIAPVGDFYQQLVQYRKKEGKIISRNLIAVAFVPFV